MTIKTCLVTGKLTRPDGSPDAGASVLAQLSQAIVYNGIIIPVRVLSKSDASGAFSLSLWPNSLVAEPESFYRILIVSSAGNVITYSIKVPDLASSDIQTLIDGSRPPNTTNDLAAMLISLAEIEANVKSEADTIKTDLAPLKAEISTLKSETNNAVKSVAVNDADQIVITHFDGSKHLIDAATAGVDLSLLRERLKKLEADFQAQGVDFTGLKDKLGQVEHDLKNNTDNVFVYSGSSEPNYPPVSSEYYLCLTPSGSKSLEVHPPVSSEGSLLHISNGGSDLSVDLVSGPPITIDGGTSVSIPPGSWFIFVKKAADWVKVSSGLLSTRSYPVTASKLALSVDNGPVPNTLINLTSLSSGWWSVPDTNTSVTDKPPNINGYFEVLILHLTSGQQSPFSMLFAFGKNTQNFAQVWVKYRITGLQWTLWNSTSGPLNSKILTEIEKLKAGNLELVSDLKSLKTSLGSIYAPNKLIFDTAANELIATALSTHKSDLEASGWGPLVDVAGAGKLPLPAKIPKIYAAYSIAVPTTVGTAGQAISTSGTLNLIRHDSVRKRVFVMIRNDLGQGDRVTGFVVDDGVKSTWESRGSDIGGVKYKIFYTSGAFTDMTNKIQVLFAPVSGP